MPTARFSGNNQYELDVNATQSGQNYDGNYSDIYWRVIVRKLSGSGFWGGGGSGSADSNQGGNPDLWNQGGISFDFRNGQSTGEWMFASGTFRNGHDGNGYGSYFVDGSMTLGSLGSASVGTGWRNNSRIPKVPRAPHSLQAVNIGPIGFGVNYKRGDDMGAGIVQDQANWRRRDNGSLVWDDTRCAGYTSPLNGAGPTLIPGTEYRVGIRSRNSRGWGPWSGEVVVRTLPAARVRINGEWKNAIPYVRINNEWKVAVPYVRQNGSWKIPQ